MMDVIVDDTQRTVDLGKIKKVFCSQSVILMLRYALESNGPNAKLLESVNAVNSRLVSPKQVAEMLQMHGAVPIDNDVLSRM